MSIINTGGPAFPRNILDHGHGVTVAHESGMTLRQYAAIKLRVPNSGTDWLDEMIVQSLRDEFAAKAMQSELVGGVHEDDFPITARRSYKMADAMLKARES